MEKDGVRKEKRKVVRRDPEKRRLQNLQAQKKYSEPLSKIIFTASKHFTNAMIRRKAAQEVG